MSANRISKYLRENQPELVSNTIPAGFVVVPASLMQNPVALSTSQQLHLQALAAALAQAERNFLAIMRSLRN